MLVPLLVFVLLTSQYAHAYPSSSIETMRNYPMTTDLKQEYPYSPRHDLTNEQHHRFNDDIPVNWEELAAFIYSIMPRSNRKRLIDF